MENIFALTNCGDGTCCCLPLQTSTILIAFISLVAGTMDARTKGCLVRQPCALQEHVETFSQIHLVMFQVANLVLLAGVAFERISLLDLYILYTLSYVVMGVVVAILDFLLALNVLGLLRSFGAFFLEIAFFFVLSQCLPLVDDYRSQLLEVEKEKNSMQYFNAMSRWHKGVTKLV